MIALSDLNDFDQAKYVDLVNPDGTFEVNITKGSWAISYFVSPLPRLVVSHRSDALTYKLDYFLISPGHYAAVHSA
jgi:hypothetical protein